MNITKFPQSMFNNKNKMFNEMFTFACFCNLAFITNIYMVLYYIFFFLLFFTDNAKA